MTAEPVVVVSAGDSVAVDSEEEDSAAAGWAAAGLAETAEAVDSVVEGLAGADSEVAETGAEETGVEETVEDSVEAG